MHLRLREGKGTRHLNAHAFDYGHAERGGDDQWVGDESRRRDGHQ